MRRRWMSGVMAVGLLMGAAACGSDDDSGDAGDTTAATSATTMTDESAMTEESSAGSAADDTMATTGGSGVAAPDVDLSGLSEAQAQVATENLAAAEAAGVEIDAECFVAAVKQLSDEDAEKIAAAGPNEDPDISPEGEAAGEDAALCVVAPEVDSTTTTAAG